MWWGLIWFLKNKEYVSEWEEVAAVVAAVVTVVAVVVEAVVAVLAVLAVLVMSTIDTAEAALLLTSTTACVMRRGSRPTSNTCSATVGMRRICQEQGCNKRSKVKGQRSKVKGQRSKVKGQRSKVKGQRSNKGQTKVKHDEQQHSTAFNSIQQHSTYIGQRTQSTRCQLVPQHFGFQYSCHLRVVLQR